MRKNITARVLILSILVLFATTGIASAQQINVTFGEPSLGIASTSVPYFLRDFYLLAVGIAGVLAVGAIVIGGIMYSISGAVDKKGLGKEIILGALWGLVLLLAAYVILRTVNPRLVELELQDLEKVGIQRCGDIEGLPWCVKNQPEINPETGECQCKNKLPYACPKSIKSKTFTKQDAPLYSWTKEYGPIPNLPKTFEGVEIPDISEEAPGVCPSRVKLEEGTTPYFITSVDKDDGIFVLDLSKQPIFQTLTFPLPPGEYYGNTSRYFITGQPNKALCLITTIEGITNYDIFQYGLKDTSLCSGDSSDAENEAELEIKSFKWSGAACLPGVSFCSVPTLLINCPDFGLDVFKASMICRYESGGLENPNSVSESDYCFNNEGNKPKAERHPFSMGLWQINVIAHGPLVTRFARENNISDPDSCEGLFDKTSGPPLIAGTSKYNCNFNVGKEAQWEQCRQILSNHGFNTGMACELYKKAGNKFTDWKNTVKKCAL